MTKTSRHVDPSAEGVPGNPAADIALAMQLFVKVGRSVFKMERLMENRGEDKMRIKEIRIKSGSERDGEALVTVKARMGDHDYVGFASASSAVEALRLALEKVENETLRWKEDTVRNTDGARG